MNKCIEKNVNENIRSYGKDKLHYLFDGEKKKENKEASKIGNF